MSQLEVGPPEDWGVESSDRRVLARNAIWMSGAQLANVLLALVTTLAISRMLGAAALGRWRFAQAATSYLLVFSDAGLSSLAIREIAKDKRRTDLYGVPVVIVQTAAAAVLYALLAALVLASSLPSPTAALVLLVGLTVFPQALSIGHVLQGHQRMELFARLRVLAQLAWTAIGLALLVATKNLLWLVPPMLVAALASDAIMLRVSRSYGATLRLPTARQIVSLLRDGMPFLVAGVAIQLIYNADALILEWRRGETELGLYAASYVLAVQILLLVGRIVAAAYPQLASHGHSQRGVDLLRELTSLIGMLVLPVGIGTLITADLVLGALYGPSFATTGPILATVMTLPVIGAYNTALGQTLGAGGHQKSVMVVSLVSAAVNVGVNLALIPVFGIGGAAVAVVAGEVSTAVWFTLQYRRLYDGEAVSSFLESLPAALIMGVVVGSARFAGLNNLLALVVLGGAVYVACSLALPSFGRRHWRSYRRGGSNRLGTS